MYTYPGEPSTGHLEGNKTGTATSNTTQPKCRVNLRRLGGTGGMFRDGPVRKDSTDHSERLFSCPLEVRMRDAFLSLNPSEWGDKRIINKD